MRKDGIVDPVLLRFKQRISEKSDLRMVQSRTERALCHQFSYRCCRSSARIRAISASVSEKPKTSKFSAM